MTDPAPQRQPAPAAEAVDVDPFAAAVAATAAPPARQPEPLDLFDRLVAEPFSFDFFLAVRRLECAAAAAGRPRIGTSAKPQQDPVRFAQQPSLAFPTSTVASYQRPTAEGSPARMAVNFMGMWGSNGPLPLHLTDYARDLQRNQNDDHLVRFMDVFHHRMISLFYRAWAVNQQAVASDRAVASEAAAASAGPGDVAAGDEVDLAVRANGDRFAAYVASLIGRGMSSMLRRDAVPDDAKLHWAGHLSGETNHAEGLAAILAGHFSAPCAVIPFAGHWIELPAESRCVLGRAACRLAPALETPEPGKPDPRPRGRTLQQRMDEATQSAVVGSRVWDCQSKFRIRLGPLPMATFARLLPGQPGNRALRAWIRNYAGDQLAWEARIVLAAVAVPGVQLGGGEGHLPGSGLLGLSTWLPVAGRKRMDADDLILHS